MATQFPLREKRKAATRLKFMQSAQTLFATQGYDETTLEQVAAHAGLHVQTLYRHFASKQELATAGERAQLERFRLAIRDPQRSDDTFTLWREWVRVAATRVTRDGGQQYRDYLIQRQQNPQVSAQLMDIATEYEDLLAESLADDFDMSADGLGAPRLVATMLWGANAFVVREHRADADHDLVGEVVAAVEKVEALFGQLVRPGG